MLGLIISCVVDSYQLVFKYGHSWSVQYLSTYAKSARINLRQWKKFYFVTKYSVECMIFFVLYYTSRLARDGQRKLIIDSVSLFLANLQFIFQTTLEENFT